MTTMIETMATTQHWDRSQPQARIKTSSTAYVISAAHGDTGHLIDQKDRHVTIVTSLFIVDKWDIMRTMGVIGTGLRTLISNPYRTGYFTEVIKSKAPTISNVKYCSNQDTSS